MHYDILDQKRLSIAEKLSFVKKEGFYLAGGTALALHFGHRDSIDFDFFRKEDIDTRELFSIIEKEFSGHVIIKTQDEHNTLSCTIDDVSFSFFTFPYKMIGDMFDEKHMTLASVEDIGCMKLSAITSRSTMKDYVDLYYILKQIQLSELLNKSTEKFPTLDTQLIIKSLVYFDDIDQEKIIFKDGFEISLDDIKKFLNNEVKKVS